MTDIRQHQAGTNLDDATRRAEPSRSAVVDLGSNSVRLVVFEGLGRNPVPIFNEKAVLRLGRGLQDSGRLNEDGVRQAFAVMTRYHAVATAMAASPFEVLATAAVRDATNGQEFVRGLEARMPGVPIRILSGEEEAALSTAGVLCGIPEARGLIADIGGGSLELVRLGDAGHARLGQAGARTLPLGVIRLSDRAGGDIARARVIAEQELDSVPWLAECAGETLYLVGGAWRTLARIHMEQTGYPLAIIHRYALDHAGARDLAGLVSTMSRRVLERQAGVSRRRVEDLPLAAGVRRRLLRASSAARCVFSATGLREGWFMQHVTEQARQLNPLLAAGREMAQRFARSVTLPPHLVAWTAPLFESEEDQGEEQRAVREAACWMSDIGSYDHPEYRAEQAYQRVLRQPGVALDHAARAFLAITLALRYEAEPDMAFLDPARRLLDLGSLRRAEMLGTALRLAYTVSGGTIELLARTKLRREGPFLVLRLAEGAGVFAGESVNRRLERLAQASGLEPRTEIA